MNTWCRVSRSGKTVTSRELFDACYRRERNGYKHITSVVKQRGVLTGCERRIGEERLAQGAGSNLPMRRGPLQ